MKNRFLDTFFGKAVLIIVIYVLYWLVFYGSWFLIPYNFFYDRNIEINQLLFMGIYIILIPILSFLIPHYIYKKIKINKKLLYFIHMILIILSILLFLHIGLTIAIKHFSIG